MTVDDLAPIKRALLSVSNKTGLAEFGSTLSARGIEIISTGGTSRRLVAAGVAVTEVGNYTGFPEVMDGRVKTLHPKIHGGILALRNDSGHIDAMGVHGIGAIDLVVVNLYPFEDMVAAGAMPEQCIENIDIGGPAMIRAAAKNYAHVTVVTEPADYAVVLEDMEQHSGATSLALRQRLAEKAFASMASYDSAVATWFARQEGTKFPERFTFTGVLGRPLSYGENPHQAAALYMNGPLRSGVASATHVQGKGLSYNNLADSDAAYDLVAEFNAPAVAIIKHANPCGAAAGQDIESAYWAALACDKVSSFGGVVAANRPLDGDSARAITEIFTEVVIAPEANDDARQVFAEKRNLRLLLTGDVPDPAQFGMSIKPVAGGFLLQERDNGHPAEFRTVTKRAPTDQELSDLRFATRVVKHVKSNAIVFAKGRATVGIGAGQMSRVDAVELAVEKARKAGDGEAEDTLRTRGSVVASDAFFPFADGLKVAAEAGATAVIQPGGSKRDGEVIAAADAAGLAMVFTDMRHFRH